MNLRQLETLIIVADAGGFASAAERLHLSQPAASRQIQALEAELGVLLFDRIGRRLLLTSEGEDIVRRGRRLLQDADFTARPRRRAQGRADRDAAGRSQPTEHRDHSCALRHPLPPQAFRHIEVHFVEDGGARMSDRLAQGDAQIVLTSVGNALFFSRWLYPAYALAVVAPSHPLGRRATLSMSVSLLMSPCCF